MLVGLVAYFSSIFKFSFDFANLPAAFGKKSYFYGVFSLR
jgi:hypothetical protein